MMRDKLVEEAVVSVLRDRAMDCISYEGYSGSEVADPTSKCGELKVLTIVINVFQRASYWSLWFHAE